MVGNKLAAAGIFILVLAIGCVTGSRMAPGLQFQTGAPAGSPASPDLPPESTQIAAIKQLNDTFLEVMSEYSDIRQEYLADKQQDRDGRFIPRVEALYKKIASGRRRLSLLKVSPNHRQAMGDAQQNSLYLANSIFEFYDALLTGGDYRSQQLDNSAKDYEKALPYYTSLSVARQAS
jgi:hypothetical protein